MKRTASCHLGALTAMSGLKVVEGCSLQKGWKHYERYYIAYGSNLNIRQMRIRCPHARVIGTAVIHDYELLFKGSRTGAYLTIEPKEGSEVPVAATKDIRCFITKKKWNLISGASARGRYAEGSALCTSCMKNGRSEYLPFRMSAHAFRGTSALGLTSITFPRHR